MPLTPPPFTADQLDDRNPEPIRPHFDLTLDQFGQIRATPNSAVEIIVEALPDGVGPLPNGGHPAELQGTMTLDNDGNWRWATDERRPYWNPATLFGRAARQIPDRVTADIASRLAQWAAANPVELASAGYQHAMRAEAKARRAADIAIGEYTERAIATDAAAAVLETARRAAAGEIPPGTTTANQ